MATVNEIVRDIVQESLVQMPESVASLIAEYSFERNPLLIELEAAFTECGLCTQLSHSGRLSHWVYDDERVLMRQQYFLVCPSCDTYLQDHRPRCYFRIW
jgi:hypothetical protein